MSSKRNEDERLRDLERRLAADDPRLAYSLRHFQDPRAWQYRGWLRPAALACTVVLALLCLLLGLPGQAVLVFAVPAALVLAVHAYLPTPHAPKPPAGPRTTR